MDFNIENMPIQIEEMESSEAEPGPSSQPEESQKVSEDETTDDEEEDSDDENDKPTTRKESKLAPHLKGLMGEANLRYARGDSDTAKKMCFEVIRQAPDGYEPYVTLAQIYESSNAKKHKAYLMLASHLAPSNSAIGCRLAELFVQEGDDAEAIKCYGRMLKYDQTNLDLHMKRLELLEQRGKVRATLGAKLKMLKKMPKRNHQRMVQFAMEAAKQYFELKNYARAIETLQIVLRRIPNRVTQDVINMLLELLLISDRLAECLDIFTQYCNFTFDLTFTETNSLHLNSYNLPADVQIDLKMKFVSCLVRLRAEHLFPQLIDAVLLSDDVETIGDLYLDVVESLTHAGYHRAALKLLVPLVKSRNFSLAGVWLRYAECLAACDLLEPATEAYFTVMALAPAHVDILYPLAVLLIRRGKRGEALEVLAQDVSAGRLDVAMLIEQLKLLKTIADWEAYFRSAQLLLSRHCVVLRYHDELRVGLKRVYYKEKVARLRRMRRFRNEDEEVETAFECVREPSVEEEFEVYKDMIQTAMDRREYGLLQKFVFMGMVSKRFGKYFNEIYLMAFVACLVNWDIYYGYTIIRDLIVRHPTNNLFWNWFGVMTSTADDVRHTRFLERSAGLHAAIDARRRLVSANHNAAIGNNVAAINYFLKEFKRSKSAYSAFMLSVVMLSYYFQRTARAKKKALAENITYLFLNYAKVRSREAEQECFYNLGRMYHQLGVLYLAEYYYKRVFEVRNAYLEVYPEILCLKREAAYNLHCIYKKHGNFVAARNVLLEHIVM